MHGLKCGTLYVLVSTICLGKSVDVLVKTKLIPSKFETRYFYIHVYLYNRYRQTINHQF